MKIKHPSFELIHLGGENQVTGSCHFLRTQSGATLMIDCGMSQGGDPTTPLSDFPTPIKEIDYLFLTHAHLDHMGRIPELIENGFNGEIICTHPTKALIAPMLKDALSFTDMTESQAASCESKIDELSWGFEYNQTFSLKKGVTFKLKNAGHILGSCFIRLEMPAESGQRVSILFSGDLGARDTPILPEPDPPDSSDFLVMESTYGDRLHEGRAKRVEALGALLTKALRDNGKVFIPAFALGRTQELIFEIDRLFSDSKFKKKFPELENRAIPVFVDSPLGLKITKIYSSLRDFWNAETKKIDAAGDHPINFKGLYAVENYRGHKRLMETPGPAIILAGSGMCSGGRILDHLEDGLDNEANDLFFVGYQARNSLGRKIMDRAGRKNGSVRIQNRRVSIRAHIHKLSGYSAHADQSDLARWARSMPKKPRLIKLVHGETRARAALKRHLESEFEISD